MTLQDWSDHVRGELGIEVDPDIRTLLDATRDVAHGVNRPAAPVTAFLIGYAAGIRGGSMQEIDDVTRRVLELVEQWPSAKD